MTEEFDPFSVGGFVEREKQTSLLDMPVGKGALVRVRYKSTEGRLCVIDNMLMLLWEKLCKEGMQFGQIRNMTPDYFNIRNMHVDLILAALDSVDMPEIISERFF